MTHLPAKFFALAAALFFTVSVARAEPDSPEAVTRALFTYLLNPKKDIIADGNAQKLWLTKSLRQLVATATTSAQKAAKKHPDEKIDVPDNGTFLQAWDWPTSFTISESQETPFLALVAVRCVWGPDTQYPGTKRTMTAVLAKENGSWRVSDIHSHASKFNSAATLIEDLRELAAQR